MSRPIEDFAKSIGTILFGKHDETCFGSEWQMHISPSAPACSQVRKLQDLESDSEDEAPPKAKHVTGPVQDVQMTGSLKNHLL